jgi:hypothetical protein
VGHINIIKVLETVTAPAWSELIYFTSITSLHYFDPACALEEQAHESGIAAIASISTKKAPGNFPT